MEKACLLNYQSYTHLCICIYVHRLRKTQDNAVAQGVPAQSSKLTKHKMKQRLNKPFTIAQLAATTAAKQHVSTAAQHRSHDHYKDDDDYALPFLHKTDDVIHNRHSAVKGILSEKGKQQNTYVIM